MLHDLPTLLTHRLSVVFVTSLPQTHVRVLYYLPTPHTKFVSVVLQTPLLKTMFVCWIIYQLPLHKVCVCCVTKSSHKCPLKSLAATVCGTNTLEHLPVTCVDPRFVSFGV